MGNDMPRDAGFVWFGLNNHTFYRSLNQKVLSQHIQRSLKGHTFYRGSQPPQITRTTTTVCFTLRN